MRYTRVSRLVAVAIAVLAGAGGCRPAGRADAGEVVPITAPVSLFVENNNFADVNVYAVRDGVSRRIGVVTGNGSATFRLDHSYFPTNEIVLIAVPIGGFGRAFSGALSVYAGDQIHFYITPVLNQSSAVVVPPEWESQGGRSR